MTDKLVLAAMKVCDWPVDDRTLWLAAQTRASPFKAGGRAANWRPDTIRSAERGYGVYLSWLEGTYGLEQDRLPADRVDRKRIEEFLEAYAPGRSETTAAAAIRGIAYVVRATSPPEGLPWLTKLAHRLSNTAVPARPKLPRMVAVGDLIRLGEQLMDEGSRRLRSGSVLGATTYRDGLAIAALATRPMRMRNFSALRLEYSFIRGGEGYRVIFPGKETKRRRLLDFQFPGWMTDFFDIYLEEVRPTLLRRSTLQDERWLWLGLAGARLSQAGLAAGITNAARQHLGRPVTPHLYRDCAATDVALLDPEHVGITKDVLGHATLASSQRFYNQAASFSALGRWEAVLRRLKDG